MKLYEIDAAIGKCFDEETGEVFDPTALNELIMEREKKLEGVGCKIKELRAEAKAIREEEIILAKRRKVLEAQADGAEEWMAFALDGAVFETPKLSVKYRSSEAVEFDTESVEDIIDYLEKHGYEDCLKYKLPEINKTELKRRLKEGLQSELFHIEKRSNIQIK